MIWISFQPDRKRFNVKIHTLVLVLVTSTVLPPTVLVSVYGYNEVMVVKSVSPVVWVTGGPVVVV